MAYTPQQVAQLFTWYGVAPSVTQGPSTETPEQRIQRITDELNSGTRTWGQVANSVSILPGANGNPAAPDPGTATTTPTTPATPAAPGTGSADQNDAYAFIMATLNQYGLGSLADWAWNELLQNHSSNQILLDLQNQQAFKARFPALAARQAAGLPALSPSEYIAYETSARQMMRAAGFPSGFYDNPDDFTTFIAKDVSLAELSQRVSLYTQAAYQVPVEVRQQLKSLYGVDEGGIAAYFANPDRALPILQQQFTSSEIAGDARLQHFGQLSRSEAERLASLGVTDQQAQQGFGNVYQARELFQRLPGEAPGAPGRADALGVVANDAASIERLGRQASRRRAVFESGGGYATSQQGIAGLGVANT